MIQNIVLIGMAFLLTLAYYAQIETLGGYFGIPAGLFAWAIPSFLILACAWQLAERKSNEWTFISLFIYYAMYSVYSSGGFSEVISDIVKAAGVGALGVLIGSKYFNK